MDRQQSTSRVCAFFGASRKTKQRKVAGVPWPAARQRCPVWQNFPLALESSLNNETASDVAVTVCAAHIRPVCAAWAQWEGTALRWGRPAVSWHQLWCGKYSHPSFQSRIKTVSGRSYEIKCNCYKINKMDWKNRISLLLVLLIILRLMRNLWISSRLRSFPPHLLPAKWISFLQVWCPPTAQSWMETPRCPWINSSLWPVHNAMFQLFAHVSMKCDKCGTKTDSKVGEISYI